MKIAYFVNQYPGISHSFIRREIQALERRGVDVVRFAIRPPKDAVIATEDRQEEVVTRRIVDQPKIQLLAAMIRTFIGAPLKSARCFISAMKMGVRSEAGLLRHFLYFVEALVLASWVKESGARHVHAHFGTNAALIAMLAADIRGVPFSFTVHGPEEFEKPDLISLRVKCEAADFVVAISQFGQSQLKKLTAPAHWRKIRIVRCGIEPAFYESADVAAPDEPHFVCVGRLCAEKAQIDLVEAVARARDAAPGLRVTLIGDGPMRPAIETAIVAHDLSANVALAGWKTPAEVREAILRSRGFILPSYAEGLPVSIMEALSLRRPVISTFVAGIPELLDAKCGWIVPAGDVDAIARALVEASACDSEALAALGGEGRRRVIERHDIDHEAGVLAACFAEVARS